jgi:hypothetical protein
MAGVLGDDPPGSIAEFTSRYAVREFDGKSDVCLKHTWPRQKQIWRVLAFTQLPNVPDELENLHPQLSQESLFATHSTVALLVVGRGSRCVALRMHSP